MRTAAEGGAGLFLPNMVRREHRMVRYPEWKDSAARTGFLLPRPWRAPPDAASGAPAPQ